MHKIQDTTDCRVIQLMNITLDEPRCIMLARMAVEYPQKRQVELNKLCQDLESEYQQFCDQNKCQLTTASQNKNLEDVKNQETKESLVRMIAITSSNVSQMQESLTNINRQIKKDTNAIRWMNTWRVIWGILCTAGILFVGVVFIFGLIISIFFPSSDDRK